MTAARRPHAAVSTRAADLDSDVAAALRLIPAAAFVAGTNVELVAESVRRAADAFRRGDLRTGRREWAQTVTAVRTLVLATGLLMSAPGVDETLQLTSDVLVACLRATLASLDARRRRGDWNGVASLLEQDMASLLADWSSLLRVVRERTRAGGRQALGPLASNSEACTPEVRKAG